MIQFLGHPGLLTDTHAMEEKDVHVHVILLNNVVDLVNLVTYDVGRMVIVKNRAKLFADTQYLVVPIKAAFHG